jgi:AcrR family transcriptional regulator
MNLKERIAKERFRIADNAAKLFQQRHQGLDSESVKALIERAQIHSNRGKHSTNNTFPIN